jgi:hypothetical protein
MIFSCQSIARPSSRGDRRRAGRLYAIARAHATALALNCGREIANLFVEEYDRNQSWRAG